MTWKSREMGTLSSTCKGRSLTCCSWISGSLARMDVPFAAISKARKRPTHCLSSSSLPIKTRDRWPGTPAPMIFWPSRSICKTCWPSPQNIWVTSSCGAAQTLPTWHSQEPRRWLSRQAFFRFIPLGQCALLLVQPAFLTVEPASSLRHPLRLLHYLAILLNQRSVLLVQPRFLLSEPRFLLLRHLFVLLDSPAPPLLDPTPSLGQPRAPLLDPALLLFQPASSLLQPGTLVDQLDFRGHRQVIMCRRSERYEKSFVKFRSGIVGARSDYRSSCCSRSI